LDQSKAVIEKDEFFEKMLEELMQAVGVASNCPAIGFQY